jgi:hypothetical protein
MEGQYLGRNISEHREKEFRMNMCLIVDGFRNRSY